MPNYTFIDRYFYSQFELLDYNYTENRDINTLSSYLENLHSVADKLKEIFDCNIKNIPEFKLLRIIRNYFHHVDDIDEYRMYVALDKDVILTHSELVVIPVELFAKSIKSFIDNNTVAKTNRNYQRKIEFISSEISSLYEVTDCHEIVRHIEAFCNNPRLKLDGKIYKLGFDLFPVIYNITNIIADKCRSINQLSCKDIVLSLDETYTESNNIEKNNLFCRPSAEPLLTTEGYIFADKIERVI